MAESSISFVSAKNGGLKHNDRTEDVEPDYLLEEKFREGNEIDVSAIDAQKKINSLYKEAELNYKNTFNQDIQAKSFLREALVNLNKNHTLKEVNKLVERLEKETGFTSTQKAIHRDEGHMEIDEDGKEVAIHNYHAHLTFFTLDRKTGQQLYRRDIPKSLRSKYRKTFEALYKLNPVENIIRKIIPRSHRTKKLWNVNDPVINKKIMKKFKEDGYIVYDRPRMSYLQTITAEVLQMERGSVSVKEEADRLGVMLNPNPSTRQGHKQYRQHIRIVEGLSKDLKNQKTENIELEKAWSESIIENTGSEMMVTDLEEENKKLDKLAYYTDTIYSSEIGSFVDVKKSYKKSHKDKEAEIKILKTQLLEKDKKILDLETQVKGFGEQPGKMKSTLQGSETEEETFTNSSDNNSLN